MREENGFGIEIEIGMEWNKKCICWKNKHKKETVTPPTKASITITRRGNLKNDSRHQGAFFFAFAFCGKNYPIRFVDVCC